MTDMSQNIDQEALDWIRAREACLPDEGRIHLLMYAFVLTSMLLILSILATIVAWSTYGHVRAMDVWLTIGTGTAFSIVLAFLWTHARSFRTERFKEDAEIVVAKIRDGDITSLSEKETDGLLAVVGLPAFKEAVHAGVMRTADHPSRPRTRSDLAAASGLSDSTIERLEKGMDVSTDTREKVARILPDVHARAQVVRAQVDALIRLEEPVKRWFDVTRFILGHVPFGGYLALGIGSLMLAHLLFVETSTTFLNPTPVLVAKILGVFYIAWIAHLCFAGKRVVDRWRIEGAQASRLVIAGIRDGSIRFLDRHTFRCLEKFAGSAETKAALDAAPRGLSVGRLETSDASR